MRSDSAQMADLSGGSEEFGQHLTAALPRLKRFGRKLTGSAIDGDDLVQATCHRALERQHLWRSSLPIDSWLLRIMHNLWVDQLRAQSARRRMTEAFGADTLGWVDGSRAQEARLMLRAVEHAAGRLPEGQRQVLNAIVVEGLTYQEAATKLKVPIGTIMSRLTRARAKLLKVVLGGLVMAAASPLTVTRKAVASEGNGASHMLQAKKPTPIQRDSSPSGQGWAEAGSAVILGWLAVSSAYGADRAAETDLLSLLPDWAGGTGNDARLQGESDLAQSDSRSEPSSVADSSVLPAVDADSAVFTNGGAKASSSVAISLPAVALPLRDFDGGEAEVGAPGFVDALAELGTARARAADGDLGAEQAGSERVSSINITTNETGPAEALSAAVATSENGLAEAKSVAEASSVTGPAEAESVAEASSVTGPAEAESVAEASSVTGPAEAESAAEASSETGPAEAESVAEASSETGPAEAESVAEASSETGPAEAESVAEASSETGPAEAESVAEASSETGPAEARSSAEASSETGPAVARSSAEASSLTGPAVAESFAEATSSAGPTTAALSRRTSDTLDEANDPPAAGIALLESDSELLFFEEASAGSSDDLLDLIGLNESGVAAGGAFARQDQVGGDLDDFALVSEDSALQVLEFGNQDDALTG